MAFFNAPAPLPAAAPAQSSTHTRRLARRALLAPLALGLALAACHKAAPADPPAAKPAPAGLVVLSAAQISAQGIQTAPAMAADIAPVGTVPGVVSLPPEDKVAVAVPFAGTVIKLMAIAGQQVRRGEPLAVVRAADTVQFGAALARSQAELPVVSAQAARMGQLAREGIIAPARADEARAALRATEATIAENRRLLAMGGASGDGTITLRAPISGRVASVGVDVGGAVGNGAAPFLVENTARLRLDLQIPERLAGRLRPGMAVRVVQEGRVASGRLLSVGGSLDPATLSVAAKASLDPGAPLIPGKGVMVAIAGPAAPAMVSVPAAALAHGAAGDAVFVRVAQGFRMVPVTSAGQIAERAYLAAGVAAGAQVATSGIAELKTLAQGQ